MGDINSLEGSCLYSTDNHLADEKDILDHPDFKYFCELIRDIQNSKSDTTELNNHLHSMKNVMRRLFGTSFELTIVDNELSTSAFVCNVFPPYRVCKEIADLIIEEDVNEISHIREIWSKVNLWHVDLDSRIFFDSTFGFNPAEIAVLIIHNIERVIFSYEIVTRVNFIVNKNFAERNYTMNKLARSHVCRRLFILPFFNACMFKTYPLETSELIDGSCLSEGYLHTIYNNAVRRLMCYAGNNDIDNGTSALDAEIQGACDWIFACITDLKYSTRMLKETLRKIVLSQKSYYVKNAIVDILVTFGDYSKADVIAAESANPILQERFARNPKAVELRQKELSNKANEKIEKAVAVAESFLDLLDNIGNMKKINQRDIDVLRINVQKIANTDDKLFVLDDVHNKLDIVETSLALLDSGDRDKMKKVKMSKSSLMDYKKQLDDIRNLIIKREIKSPNYSVFVKYPAGYEG